MPFSAKEIGVRIRRLRKNRGITFGLAAKELNMSESYYRKVESGERVPSLDVLLAISAYYEVTTDYLLKGETHTTPYEELSIIITKLQHIKHLLSDFDHNQGQV